MQWPGMMAAERVNALFPSSNLLLLPLTSQTHQKPEGKEAHDAINMDQFPKAQSRVGRDLEEQMENIQYSFFPRTDSSMAL